MGAGTQMAVAKATDLGMAEREVAAMDISAIEHLLVQGDLSKVSAEERVDYYRAVCKSIGLNPLTQPFEYIVLNGKMKLYAKKDATDQLRTRHRISITKLEEVWYDGTLLIKAYAETPDGRTDVATGAVDVGKLQGENRANAFMKAECVPLDSEILTRRGFVTYDNTIIGEEVLAYDCATDTCRWTPLLNVTTHQELPMVRLYTDKGLFGVICTPDHSWAVKRPEYKTRSTGDRAVRGPYKNRQESRGLVKASEIKTSHRIILSAPVITNDASLLTPDEAAILGWAVTDGTIQTRGTFKRIGICQSKELYLPLIAALVKRYDNASYECVSKASSRTFPMSGRTYDTLPQHWYYLPAQSSRDLLNKAGFKSRADLARIACHLNEPARAAMLEAMEMAESDSRRNFAQTDKDVLEAFQILCTLQGEALGNLMTIKGNCNVQKVMTTRHIAGAFLNIDPIKPAPAWCPTTQYGTWVMRQGGRVMITGNTKAKRRVTLSICGLGWLDETETGSIPDARVGAVDVATGEIIQPQAAVRPQVAPDIESRKKAAKWLGALRENFNEQQTTLYFQSRGQLVGDIKAADLTLAQLEQLIKIAEGIRDSEVPAEEPPHIEGEFALTPEEEPVHDDPFADDTTGDNLPPSWCANHRCPGERRPLTEAEIRNLADGDPQYCPTCLAVYRKSQSKGGK